MAISHHRLKRFPPRPLSGGYSVAGRTHRTFNPARSSSPHRGFESHPALHSSAVHVVTAAGGVLDFDTLVEAEVTDPRDLRLREDSGECLEGRLFGVRQRGAVLRQSLAEEHASLYRESASFP